jgi:DNA-binding HxlR family transcriptional regulator
VTPRTPVRIDYRLTEKGQALAGVVFSIAEWAEAWMPQTPSSVEST